MSELVLTPLVGASSWLASQHRVLWLPARLVPAP